MEIACDFPFARKNRLERIKRVKYRRFIGYFFIANNRFLE